MKVKYQENKIRKMNPRALKLMKWTAMQTRFEVEFNLKLGKILRKIVKKKKSFVKFVKKIFHLNLQLAH
jgi:hypothetical protein